METKKQKRVSLKVKEKNIGKRELKVLMNSAINWDKSTGFSPTPLVKEKIERYIAQVKTLEELEIEEKLRNNC